MEFTNVHLINGFPVNLVSCQKNINKLLKLILNNLLIKAIYRLFSLGRKDCPPASSKTRKKNCFIKLRHL